MSIAYCKRCASRPIDTDYDLDTLVDLDSGHYCRDCLDQAIRMEDTILVSKKNEYGRERIYPENELARTICALAGRKTLKPSDLEAFKAHGFGIAWTMRGPHE